MSNTDDAAVSCLSFVTLLLCYDLVDNHHSLDNLDDAFIFMVLQATGTPSSVANSAESDSPAAKAMTNTNLQNNVCNVVVHILL
jgi:hypothetical protein